MKSYQRIPLFILAVILLTCLLSPWVAALWDFIIDSRPDWQGHRLSFSRIFSRLLALTGVILFFFSRPLLRIQSLRDLGLGPLRQGYQDLLRGFGLAAASLVLLGAVMSLAGNFSPYFRLSLSVTLERSLNALLTGLSVGLLEEIFFRGMIFKGLMEDTKAAIAFLAANLFYAASHFIDFTHKFPLSGLDPFAGVRYLISSFEPFLDPSQLAPGLVGLFLIGAVLSYAFLRTGSLYLSIGLHAGWIFGLKTLRVYGDFSGADLGWLFGYSDPKLVSGAAAWAGILAVGIVVHVMTRKRN